ncbi:MAG: DinB family protein [Chloroflexota bacterium]|nr:DinB family protein [Chloroflexota bacterium]
MIDFTAIERDEQTLLELGRRLRVGDLRQATIASIDHLKAIIEQADDAMITFVPHDPEANDPFAAPDEQHIGWTLGHLVAHVTATSEESAAIASILARGIPYPREPRLRYETPWRDITTQAQALQRLDESLRMRLGYLDAFPDMPHLDVYRELSDNARAKFGDLNATANYLLGLKHEAGHYAQFADVLAQAQAAVVSV